MAPTGHSTFPASSSSRLIACPGSYELGLQLSQGRRSTIYSAEGTLAHSLSEASILTGADPSQALGRKFSTDGFEFDVDQEFVDAVQVYVDFVQGLIAMGYLVALETRVSPTYHWTGLPDLGLDLFGTADCIAYHPEQNDLLIGDLKFGKGVPVEVQANDQVLYYGAGAMNPEVINAILAANGYAIRVGGNWQPASVRTVIIQPRASHPQGPVRHHDYTAQEVVDWARQRLYGGVEAAIKDKGQTLVAGKHCRFCPALPHCEAHRQHMQDTARQMFAAVPTENIPLPDLLVSSGDESSNEPADPLDLLPAFALSDAMLADLLDRITILKPFIAAVEALAKDRDAKAPGTIPGWASAPTQPRRKWGEDDDAEQYQALLKAGLAHTEIMETKLLSPAQVQKRVGKRRYDQLVKPFVGRASSGTTLVPVADPRVRRNARSAQEAFGLLPAPDKTTNQPT